MDWNVARMAALEICLIKKMFNTCFMQLVSDQSVKVAILTQPQGFQEEKK